LNKKEILREFSADPQRYYAVRLFEDEGFTRKSCRVCGRFFWTLDAARDTCPDDGSDTYSFIGDPPTSARFDYAEAWRQVESFFVENGHTSVSRYPVVCRWRDDLYFTIASIVDFQRVMGSKVVFEFPANPLVVPQTCLRFKDLENVGVTGRHFSSFCMVGQHSIPDSEDGKGYWKDRCIDLDYHMLTRRFGIDADEIVFVEDVWSGGGSFGSSLEYFVRGLELGNAVFTEFQGELGRHTTLDRRIIDMGAGLERLSWITMGTPTAYDCCFGGIERMLQDVLGIDTDSDLLRSYYVEVSKELERTGDLWEVRRLAVSRAGISDDMADRLITPLEGIYMVVDHLRTLVFAIADGALPSNVGGGYNLRMMIRRVSETMRRLGLSNRIHTDELVDAHIDYLKGTYTELDGRRDDVKKIIRIEAGRYAESRTQMQKKVARVRRRGEPSIDDLLTLYESDGITPEYLVEEGVLGKVPSEFYTRLSELHQSQKIRRVRELPLDGVAETKLLFYADDPAEFEATVLWSDGREMVALDRTSFYARGGGQEPDLGTIDGLEVTDVQKHAGVVVHVLKGGRAPDAGSKVTCSLNVPRREAITKNHTSTHILNTSSRGVLGSWVWQHSAFKDEDHARLDITHHSSLTDEQVRQIEDAANDMIRDDLPVSISYMDRGTAERKYGFSIYQGGVVPVKSVRIVSISDKDVEACGGTHVQRTGQIGRIKITRTKRIQDGVVRLEFLSGRRAADYEEQQRSVAESVAAGSANREEDRRRRQEERERIRLMISEIIGRVAAAESDSTTDDYDYDYDNDNDDDDDDDDGDDDNSDNVDGYGRVMNLYVEGATKVCLLADDEGGEYLHMNLGKKMTGKMSHSAYVGVFRSGPAVRVVAYVGSATKGTIDASRIVDSAARVLGGGRGGTATFAQGGGTNSARHADAMDAIREEIRKMLAAAGGRPYNDDDNVNANDTNANDTNANDDVAATIITTTGAGS